MRWHFSILSNYWSMYTSCEMNVLLLSHSIFPFLSPSFSLSPSLPPSLPPSLSSSLPPSLPSSLPPSLPLSLIVFPLYPLPLPTTSIPLPGEFGFSLVLNDDDANVSELK